MFQSWRMKLRDAEDAFRAGRLEEASQLLRQPELRDFLPAKRLLAKVASQMVSRAGQRVAGGQSSAGWRDLQSAVELGADNGRVGELRAELTARRLAEAESYLSAGEPLAALARMEELHRNGVSSRESRLLEEVAAKMVSAQRHCHRGQFTLADEELAAAAALQPNLQKLGQALEDARQACSVKAAECRRQSEQLHEALASQNWTQVLSHAESLLALCPEHEAARDARRRAWGAVGTNVSQARCRIAPHESRRARPAPLALAMHQSDPQPSLPPRDHAPATARMNGHDAAATRTTGERFQLWIDGVGGYLVCLGDEILLGQPAPDRQADVPILADLSRSHARIRRDGEGYLIEPIKATSVNGRALDQPTSLVDGALIELGSGVQLRFRKPHALSSTARLEFVSRHRTQPSADAVLLMAESCVLGPGANCHIRCLDWTEDLTLFRVGKELYCRRRSGGGKH